MPTPDYYQGKETIDKQEYVAYRLVDHGMVPCRAFDMATAIKYVDRAGDKPGEDAKKDLDKAVSYLFRALYGAWPWDAEDDDADD